VNAIPRIIRLGAGKRVSKFNNARTLVDGIRFDSKKEAAAWSGLQILLRMGRIRNLERQVTFRLEIAGQLICSYRADFVYEEYVKGDWIRVVHDAKGMITPLYRLKKKLMKALHGIEIRES
jgi:hypothetical protein